MKLLCDQIQEKGTILPGNVIKVDCIINHQIDTNLLVEMGKEFHRLFKNEKVDKILTVESSGISMACATAMAFGNIPVVFAKKHRGSNTQQAAYCARTVSYTHGYEYDMTVAKDFLKEGENVLLIDDFLATGGASYGMIEICKQANVNISGIGIAIEKAWQDGGKNLRNDGYHVESLARVESVNDGKFTFID